MYRQKVQSNFLEVSRAALRRNAAAVADSVGVPVIGIIKCNGYGMSIPEAAFAWKAAGVTMFGVSRPEEAAELRRCGFTDDVLLLAPVADRETLETMVELGVILTVTSFENARFYATNSERTPIRVHIAVDTGMGRFGIRWTDLQQLESVYYLQGLQVEGIFSHFAKSFETGYCRTRLQLQRFLSVTNSLTASGFQVGIRHIANSSAALRFPETRLDAVRIGSALVGRVNGDLPVPLEPVGVFRGRVVDCRMLRAGDTTGYASVCSVRRDTRVAVVSLGREDGFGLIKTPDNLRLRDFSAYLYHLLHGWRHPPCVCFRGKQLPLVGRIGNQYTLFDAADVDIHPGDYVTWDGDLLVASCERRFV